jgi:hypothetical protein
MSAHDQRVYAEPLGFVDQERQRSNERARRQRHLRPGDVKTDVFQGTESASFKE